MFRTISLMFIFFSYLIINQVFHMIEPSYLTSRYIKTDATIVSNVVKRKSNGFEVTVSYEYNLFNQVFKGNLITDYKNKKLPFFYTFEEANSFAGKYYTNQIITVYFNDKNPSESRIVVGLLDEDITKILMLVPIVSASILIFSLAFIDKWQFHQSNSTMNSISYSALSVTLIGIPINLIIHFYFRDVLESYFQNLCMIVYIISCLISGTHRKIYSKYKPSYNKYKRLFNTEEMDIIESKPIYGFMYQLKNEGFLPITSILSLSFLICLLSWFNNSYTFTKIIYMVIICNIVLLLFYMFYLFKKNSVNYPVVTTME